MLEDGDEGDLVQVGKLVTLWDNRVRGIILLWARRGVFVGSVKGSQYSTQKELSESPEGNAVSQRVFHVF
ncbi:MAG: hypothetical protein KC592_04495 [Nitrospira sp.]|nr:hypothetical protein [Nitrospira sp.]